MSDTNQVFITALMPCLNEERTVGICVEKALRSFARLGIQGEVVVADNGSTDRSVEIAKACGARVIHVARRGYGAALIAGISAALGEFIIMADSDDSYDWLGLDAFVHGLQDGADLVIGNRFKGGIEPGAMPPLHRYIGNPVLSWLGRKVHAAPISDFHCGMRGFKRSAVSAMNLQTPGMEFATEMIVNAVRAGLRVVEVPTTLRRDGRNRAPHLRSFRDGWRHLRFILTYGPNYLFLAPGGVCLSIGLMMLAALASGPITVRGHYFGIHFLALASALTLVGFNIIHYGIIAKVVVLRRAPQSKSRLARWIILRFSLEGALAAGSALIVMGLGWDTWVFFEWLDGHGTPMESSAHSVFVATLAVVVGVNLALGSFLLHMLVSETREQEPKAPG